MVRNEIRDRRSNGGTVGSHCSAATVLRLIASATLLVFATAACSAPATQQSGAKFLDSTAVDADHSALSPILLVRDWTADSGLFTEPRSIARSGTTLAIVDQDSPVAPVQMLDATTGRTLGALGRKGKGPGEYGLPGKVFSSNREGGGIWLSSGRRMIHFAIDSNHAVRPQATFVLEGSTFLERFAWLNDSTLLAGGHLQNGYVALFRSDGTLIGERGVVPGPAADSVLFRNHAFAAMSVPHPDGSRFAQVRYYAGDIILLGADGVLIKPFETPFRFETEYVTKNAKGNPSFALRRGNRNGYLAAAATANYVYCLFSGRRPSPERSALGRSMLAGDFVHVFDWTGALRAVLQLDADARQIAVSADDNELFVMQGKPASTVAAYRIPPNAMQTMGATDAK